MSKHVIVATCGATRLLAEAGITPVHLNMAQYGQCRRALSRGWFRESDGSSSEGRPLYSHPHRRGVSRPRAEILMPLSFAYPGASTALCGDHKQLGPVVRSAFCRTNGLATSILERLIDLDVYKQQGGGASSGAPAAENGAAPEAAPTPTMRRTVRAASRSSCASPLARGPSRVAISHLAWWGATGACRPRGDRLNGRMERADR